jgi:hypothetical protein
MFNDGKSGNRRWTDNAMAKGKNNKMTNDDMQNNTQKI